MKLVIVIPALNEEESIEKIIRRCLAARKDIIEKTFVDEVDITVVSDGSTDNTVPFAQKYIEEIDLIIFEKNKGYGAAIKEGWGRSDADLLSFLDADGTCDPLFFVNLCNTLEEKEADILLGCRLNENSEMPLLRRFGNNIFALLLSSISSTRIKDTASGMRVVRKTALNKIYPLPDGLHFTPAMSARAVLSGDLVIEEIDMPYEEREGESKLHVLKDGIRFLKIILGTAFLYRPNFFFNVAFFVFLLIGSGLIFSPFLYYIENTRVEDWMIYRFVLSGLSFIIATLFLTASALSERIVRIALDDTSRDDNFSFLYQIMTSRVLIIFNFLILFAGIFLTYKSIIERLVTGATTEHWSRYIVMGTLIAIAFCFFVFKLINHFLSRIQERRDYLNSTINTVSTQPTVTHSN